MAKPRTRRNAGGASINGSGTPKPTPAIFCASTLASAAAPGPLGKYTDKDMQRATMLALELLVKGQEHGQLQANFSLCKQPLKAWLSNLYYGNLHLDCSCFCQQCKDYFETARDNGPNQVPFAALFLCRAMV